MIVECDDGTRRTALIRGRKLKPLAGDSVAWRERPDGTIVIDEILPRSSLLERIDKRGHSEGVAANVSLLVAVVAERPEPDWQLVDRYLVAASLLGIDAAIVCNKSDLGHDTIAPRARDYAALAYRVIATSARDGTGIAELALALQHERSMLVGQSGVGKSSLLNALLEHELQAVGRLSPRKSLGRHTTSSSVLHRLPAGGEIIDSPGVRRYAPSITDSADLAAGFIEFRQFLGHCRFNDCRHAGEPDCAIRRAVERGEISPRRYQSFIALRTALENIQNA